MTDPRASDEGPAVIPLALLNDLLGSVADVLHDRSVQSLVAARLLVETALPPTQRSEMLDRGLQAITSAGDQARDVMWALGGTSVRRGHVPEDISDAVSRLGRPNQEVDVTVHLDDDIDLRLVRLVVQTVHEMLIAVMMRGGSLQQLHVTCDAEDLHVSAHIAPAGAVAEDDPWIRLSRLRLRTVGGRLAHRDVDQAQVLEITVPRAADLGGPADQVRTS